MIVFSNERSFYAFLTPIKCLDHIPFGLLLFGPSRYKFTVKIRALACPVLEIYAVIEQGAADRSNRVINSANEVSNPVK